GREEGQQESRPSLGPSAATGGAMSCLHDFKEGDIVRVNGYGQYDDGKIGLFLDAPAKVEEARGAILKLTQLEGDRATCNFRLHYKQAEKPREWEIALNLG